MLIDVEPDGREPPYHGNHRESKSKSVSLVLGKQFDSRTHVLIEVGAVSRPSGVQGRQCRVSHRCT
jgi:hypothetical protein